MNTAFLLAARYDGLPAIDADRVRKDFFPHLNRQTFFRRLDAGAIPLAVTRLDSSQKSPRVIALAHLAEYIEEMTERARSEAERKR